MSNDVPRLLDVTVFQYLDSGERLLWTGRPRPGLRLSSATMRSLLGSAIWAALAIFFAINIWRDGISPSSLLTSMAFVAFAVYNTVGRVGLGWWLRSRTRYAVTDRRVLIIEGGAQPAIQSVDLTPTTPIGADLRDDGSGTLTFVGSQLAPVGRGGRRTRRRPPPAFDDIPDAQQAYAVIQQVMRTPHPTDLMDGTRTNTDHTDKEEGK